jgi:hypothetical protein
LLASYRSNTSPRRALEFGGLFVSVGQRLPGVLVPELRCSILYRRIPLKRGNILLEFQIGWGSCNDDYHAGDSGSIGGYERAVFAVRCLDVCGAPGIWQTTRPAGLRALRGGEGIISPKSASNPSPGGLRLPGPTLTFRF